MIVRKTMTVADAREFIKKHPLAHLYTKDGFGRDVSLTPMPDAPHGTYKDGGRWKPLPSATTLVRITAGE